MWSPSLHTSLYGNKWDLPGHNTCKYTKCACVEQFGVSISEKIVNKWWICLWWAGYKVHRATPPKYCLVASSHCDDFIESLKVIGLSSIKSVRYLNPYRLNLNNLNSKNCESKVVNQCWYIATWSPICLEVFFHDWISTWGVPDLHFNYQLTAIPNLICMLISVMITSWIACNICLYHGDMHGNGNSGLAAFQNADLMNLTPFKCLTL